MKITVETLPEGSETELVLRCSKADEGLIQLLQAFTATDRRLIGLSEGRIHILNPSDVLYFESVDNHVFIYLDRQVYESRLRLYELEADYGASGFIRASKSVVLNLMKIDSLSPVFDGRFKALLLNGETVVISRQYAPDLKRRLGL